MTGDYLFHQSVRQSAPQRLNEITSKTSTSIKERRPHGLRFRKVSGHGKQEANSRPIKTSAPVFSPERVYRERAVISGGDLNKPPLLLFSLSGQSWLVFSAVNCVLPNQTLLSI